MGFPSAYWSDVRPLTNFARSAPWSWSITVTVYVVLSSGPNAAPKIAMKMTGRACVMTSVRRFRRSSFTVFVVMARTLLTQTTPRQRDEHVLERIPAVAHVLDGERFRLLQDAREARGEVEAAHDERAVEHVRLDA